MCALYLGLGRIGRLHLGRYGRSSTSSGFLYRTGGFGGSGLCASSSVYHGGDLVYRGIAGSLCVLGYLGCNALTGGFDLLTQLVAIGVERLHRFGGELLGALHNGLAGFRTVVYHRVDYLGGSGSCCLHELLALFLNLSRAREVAALLVDNLAQKRAVLGTGAGRKEQTGNSAYCAAYNERCELAHDEHLPQKIVVYLAIIRAQPPAQAAKLLAVDSC